MQFGENLTRSCRLRPTRSTDQAMTLSNSHRAASLWKSHDAPSSLQNIRLSADAANPLSRSRNSLADGDGWSVGPGKPPTIGFLGANPSIESQRVAAFVQRLRELGWIEGRTVSIEYRWAEGRSERYAENVAELVRLKVDVIVTSTTPPSLAAKQATAVIPIVFAAANDPIGTGLVASLARPGGNATGFMSFEIGISAKWLELLKEIAPGVKRAAVLRTLATAAGPGQFGAIQAVAPVELRPIDTQDAGEIERAIVAFASEPNGGLIAATGGLDTGNLRRCRSCRGTR